LPDTFWRLLRQYAGGRNPAARIIATGYGWPIRALTQARMWKR
jgi:hypothetical protein